MKKKNLSSNTASGKITGGIKNYFSVTSHPLVSAFFVIPLLLFYNAGIFIEGDSVLNGADFFTTFITGYLGFRGYVIFNGVLLLIFLILIPVLIKKKMFRWKFFFPAVCESFIYAVAMGSMIVFIIKESHLLDVNLKGHPTIFQSFVISAGAGFHEELVFRFILTGLLIVFFNKLLNIKSKALCSISAIFLSSALFSLAHYLGPEPFAFFSFIYRMLAGIFFACLYFLRGFAVAAYTHTIYDISVLLF
jgi:membrane protease YdiL (CAAX protease family)